MIIFICGLLDSYKCLLLGNAVNVLAVRKSEAISPAEIRMQEFSLELISGTPENRPSEELPTCSTLSLYHK